MITDLTDNQLVEKVNKENCSDSLEILIERHTPLIIKMMTRFLPIIESMGISGEEFKQEKGLIVYYSAKTYKDNKNSKFSSWLANRVRFYCLNFINRNKKKQFAATEDLILNLMIESNRSRNEDNYQPDNEKLNDILNSFDDSRIKTLFNLRYFEGNVSWRAIAKKMGLSLPTIQKLHEKGKKIIAARMKSEFF